MSKQVEKNDVERFEVSTVEVPTIPVEVAKEESFVDKAKGFGKKHWKAITGGVVGAAVVAGAICIKLATGADIPIDVTDVIE